jgi:hypothetical protein
VVDARDISLTSSELAGVEEVVGVGDVGLTRVDRWKDGLDVSPTSVKTRVGELDVRLTSLKTLLAGFGDADLVEVGLVVVVVGSLDISLTGGDVVGDLGVGLGCVSSKLPRLIGGEAYLTSHVDVGVWESGSHDGEAGGDESADVHSCDAVCLVCDDEMEWGYVVV